MFIYTIGLPRADQDVNAVCVQSEEPLSRDECLQRYNDYWRDRKKMPAKGVVVKEVA